MQSAPPPHPGPSPDRSALRITLLYALFGVLWILFSDRILALWVASAEQITELQTYKGWFFIASTAILLFFLISRHLRHLQTVTAELQQFHDRMKRTMAGLDIAYWQGDSFKRHHIMPDHAPPQSGGRSRDCPFSATIHPDDVDVVENTWNYILISGSNRCECEHRILDSSGQWRWVLCRGTVMERDAQNRPVQVCGIHFDITGHKAHEIETRRLAAAVTNAAECIVISDGDATIRYVNPAFELMTGFTLQEVLGLHPTDVYVVDGARGTPSREIGEAIRRGRPWRGMRHTRCKSGRLVPVEITISPIQSADGKVIGYVGIHRDISEQQELENQLRQAQKMEAIGQLAGGIAHDFNNLLQVISGQTDLAMETLPEDAPARHGLDQVLEAADRATTLVRQLLAFSRNVEIKPRQLDLSAIILNLTKILRRVIGDHIEFKVETGADLLPIRADPGQVEQVIVNLCINARDAIRDSGRIEIRTANYVCSEEFQSLHGWRHGKNCVLLTIADTGHGIPNELQHRIFEPFFTTKEVGKGTGLGLATVYGIVKQHDALIRLESKVGDGTTFLIYWPVAGVLPGDGALVRQAKPIPRGDAQCILVAEDNELVRRLAVQLLKGAGYTVLEARDGEEARAIFDEQPDRIDLALLDIVMPRLSGRALQEHISGIRPQLPVIFSSGYAPELRKEQNASSKAHKVLQKPYSPNDLLIAIDVALKKPPQD
jgi:PAS domain S-box-containing protein